MNKISIEELKIVFQRIISKLDTEGISEVQFKNDLYRIIPTEDWNNFDDKSIDIGSLFDDIEELVKLSTNRERFCTYVDFDRLASILRAISQKNNPLIPTRKINEGLDKLG